jgi:hypothetical protein
MLAIQLQDSWGLAADGTFHAAVTQTVAERIAQLRTKLLTVGVPAALISGGAVTLIFAGAFKLAHSERVWAPSLWLGGVSALSGLISVALAAHAANKAEAALAPAPVTTAAQAFTTAQPVAAQKSLYGYGY